MDAPTSTGIPTQPEPIKPWKQVAEESNIFSLPAEQRVAEYDKWSQQAIAKGIRDGDFDSPDTFSQFKLLDIRTRKNLASDDIVGPSDEDILADYNSFSTVFQDTQKAFASQKPTPEDNAIQDEVLKGKRNAAFVRGQMVFNPTIVNDQQKYREAILESDAPPDIKMLYAGLRPEMEKSATVTRRRELANSVITRDVADKVVNAIQEGTEVFGVDVGTPQSPALKKNKEGVWSVVDPEYVDMESSMLEAANARYNPLADAQYKPLAAINEYQKKYGLSDEQVQQDYMEALIENAPTAVNRWVSKATSVEDYVKQLDSTVRVKNKDVAPEVRVQDPNLFFDEEGYNAAVDKANAPDEAKNLAKEARTQFADAVAGDIYNNLLANRDDFREDYAKDVVERKDMAKAITRYYKDKKDQAWYDDVGEFIGQTGTALQQGGMNVIMTPSAVLGMFGSVKDAEDVRYATMVQNGQMQAEEAVANRTGGAGAIKLTGDVARILPDLAVQMAIGIMSGGALSYSQAAALSARTGISGAAARTAIRQAAITGEKAALKTELAKLIPNLSAQAADDVATGALEVAARTMSNNPLKGGIGTQRAIGSAYAGLTSAGSTFGQVYTEVRNMGKSPEESIGIARTAGITAGAITGALTHAFGVLGRGGVEDFASMGRKAGEFTIRDIMKSGVYDVLTTQEGRQLARNIASGIAKDSLHEGVEEGLDQALNLISQYATNPSPEAQNRKVSDVINESLYATLLGGIAGGGANVVGQARATAPGITAQQMQAEILGADATVAPDVAPPESVAPTVAPATEPTPAPVVQSADPVIQEVAETAKAIADVPDTSQTAAALAGLANAAAAPIIPPPSNLPVVPGQQQPFQQPAQSPTQLQATPTPDAAVAPVAPTTLTNAVNADGTTATEPQSSGVEIVNIDDLVNNGGGVIQVSKNGREVKFKQFSFAIDGNSAEITFVELDPSERGSGVGKDAYISLGEELAKRGITLQSSKSQYGNGRNVWLKLAAEGRAKRGAQGIFYFVSQQTRPTTSESEPAIVEPTEEQPTEEMKTTEEMPITRDVTKPEQMTPEEWLNSESDPQKAASLAADSLRQAIAENKPFNTKTFKRLFSSSSPEWQSMSARWKENQDTGLTELRPESELGFTPSSQLSEDQYLSKNKPLGGWNFRSGGTRGKTISQGRADYANLIKIALKERSSVSVSGVDKLKIPLPKGYVKEGELYVFKGEEAPAAEAAAAPAPEKQAKPKPGVDAIKERFKGKSGYDKLQLVNQLIESGELIPAAFEAAETGKAFPAIPRGIMLSADTDIPNTVSTDRIPAPKIKATTPEKAAELGVSDDETRRILNGVFLDAQNQKAVSSDGKILIAIPAKITGEDRVVSANDIPAQGDEPAVKAGGIIKGSYPPWKQVVPRPESKGFEIDPLEVIKGTVAVDGVNKTFKDATVGSVYGAVIGLIKVGDAYFDHKYIKKTLTAILQSGATKITAQVDDDASPLLLTGDNGAIAVVMPVRLGSRTGRGGKSVVYTVTEKKTQPKPTKPNAVQEPKPDEGVLRQEGPEVGLPEVDQGGRGAEQESAKQAEEVKGGVPKEETATELYARLVREKVSAIEKEIADIKKGRNNPKSKWHNASKSEIEKREKKIENTKKGGWDTAVEALNAEFAAKRPVSKVWDDLLTQLRFEPGELRRRAENAGYVKRGDVYVFDEKPAPEPEPTPKQQDVVVFMEDQNDEIEERQKPKKKRITPGEARKAGIAKQIGKLGIQSNDPDSVIGALKKIAAKPPQPHHARIAKDLLSVLEGSGTSIVLVASNDPRIKKGDEQVNGWYDPQTNTAYINLDGPHELGIEETILHELVHASGEKVIRNPQTDAQKRILGDLQKQMEAATKNAISLGQSVLKTKETDLEKLIALAASKNNYALFDILYGVSSLSEYHAHATTSKAFQRFLSEYKEGSKRNFFERFVNSITRLLSGQKTTEGSDAEKSYSTLLDLMRENKGDVRLSNTDVVESEQAMSVEDVVAEPIPESEAAALDALPNDATVDDIADAAPKLMEQSNALAIKFKDFASWSTAATKAFGSKAIRFLETIWTGLKSISIAAIIGYTSTGIDSAFAPSVQEIRGLPKEDAVSAAHILLKSPKRQESVAISLPDKRPTETANPPTQKAKTTEEKIAESLSSFDSSVSNYVDFIDDKFESEILGSVALTPAMKAVAPLVGEMEGNRQSGPNKTLAKIFEVGGILGSQDEVPWCAMFISHGLNKAGTPTQNVMASQFLSFGKRTSSPKVGDVVVFNKRNDDNTISEKTAGHVGFFIRESGDFVLVLNGNVGDSVAVTALPKRRVMQYRSAPAVRTDVVQSRARGIESDSAHAELERRFKAGDKDAEQEAKALVEETAKQAGWTEKAYHGTGSPFTIFDSGRGGSVTNARSARLAFFLVDDPGVAKQYAELAVTEGKGDSERIISAFVKGNLKTVDHGGKEYEERKFSAEIQQALDEGYDGVKFVNTDDSVFRELIGYEPIPEIVITPYKDGSGMDLARGDFRVRAEYLENGFTRIIKPSGSTELVKSRDQNLIRDKFDEMSKVVVKPKEIYKNQRHTVFAVFDPNQIKSADAFTYDDDGNLIPLSERFTEQSPDIRYSKARGIVSDAVVKFAPQFNVVDAPDGPSVEFDGRSVTVNPEKLANLEEYEVQDLVNRAVVAAIATPKDPIAAGIIQQTIDVSAYNFDSESRKGIRKGLADAHRTAHEFGMAPLAMELGNRLFEFGGATDVDVNASRQPDVLPYSRARGTELVTRVSGPALAWKKFISGFRSRGMVSQETYDAYRDSDAFKKANAAFVSFIAKDFTNVTNKLFGEGGANLENFRVFSRDATTGEATVSSRGFETRQKAEAFAVTNRYKDYIVSTGQDLINQALGSNGPTLKEDVRDAIEKLTKKGLDDIAKSIEAYKEEYLDYWNTVIMQTQPGMIDPAQIATLRERKEQWMAALRLRSEEQKKLVDDARKKAVQAAIEDAKNRIVQQQQFAKAYLPDDLVHQIERARKKIDELSTRLTGINWLMEGSELQMVIEGLNGVYVTRSYEAFETSDKAAYVAWLNEAYNALTNRDQVYDPIAMERIMPLVRHIKNGIMERRIEDLKKENDQRQVDAIMEDLMADSRQVTQVDRIPGQPIEGTEYEQLIRAVAKRDLLRRRSDEKKRFVRDMMRHLDAVVGFGRNIGNRRKRVVALRKEANRIYNERYGDAEQQTIADMFGRPQGLQWAVMTDDEAHDIANVERAISESPGNLSGSAIWTSSINGKKHSTFNAAVNDDFQENLNFILKAPGAKTSVTTATANDWKRLGDKILEHKNDVPAFLRTFLGEKDNPLLRVSDTIMKQSHLIAVGNLYQNIAKMGQDQGWLVHGDLKVTDKKYDGWKTVLSSANADQGYENNPLKDMYADPVMAKAIDTLLAANQPSNSAFKVISFVVGASLWNVTAGSVRAIARNLYSLPIFLMNSGILGAVINPTRWPIVAKNIVLASRIVQQSMEATGKVSGGQQITNKGFKLADKFWTGLLSVVAAQRPALYAMRGAASMAEIVGRIKEQPTGEAFQEIYLKAVRLGVANDNVQKEAIHRLLDIEEQAIRKPKDKNMGRFAKALKLEGAVGFGSYLLGTMKSTLQQRSQLYGAPDDFTKIMAWLNEMDTQANIHAKDDAQYKEWVGKDGLFAKMPDEFVKKAADNVTNLIQSHSRVWAHITQFKKAGFGTLAAPFAAARAEFYRNAANAYIIAFEEMRSKNKKEQMNGGIRFASALMAHLAMGNAIGAVVKTVFSAFADDDEIVEGSPEYREAVRKLGPEYAKNKNATYILYKNGTFDWVDLSFANPFAFVWDSITAARRGATEKDVEDNIVVAMFKEILEENIGTFAKPQIALDAFAAIRTGYDPVRGVKIWDSQADSFTDKLEKSVSYYLKQAGAPGDYKDAMKIWKASRGVEENGRQYKVGTEVGAVFLGTSIRTVNITDALEQKLAQAKDTLGTRITPLYKAPLRNANDVEMEDVALAVQQYAKAHDQAVSAMQKSYKAAETLLRETPNAKTLLRNVMSSDRVRMSQGIERAVVTGKPSFPDFSDQTFRKMEDLGKKHSDDRAKVAKDTLKEYNQRKKNP